MRNISARGKHYIVLPVSHAKSHDITYLVTEIFIHFIYIAVNTTIIDIILMQHVSTYKSHLQAPIFS